MFRKNPNIKNMALVVIVFAITTFVVSCAGKTDVGEAVDINVIPRQTVNDMYAVQTNNGMLQMRMEAKLMQRFQNDSTKISYELFPEGFDVVINVPDEDQARFVLPCSIQLLIENATKHNAAGAENPLIIKVQSDGTQVKVSNNIIPKVTRTPSTGLGQKYIRQQYMDLSGKSILIERTEEEYSVTLPLL